MEKPEIQRLSAKGKAEVVVDLLKGTTQLVDVCRAHDLKQSEVEAWMECFLKWGERDLKAGSRDEQAVHAREVTELRAKVGELVLELDARKKWEALHGRDEPAF